MKNRMAVSRLRRVPDKAVIKNGGGSGVLVSTGLLACRCNLCGQLFYCASDTVDFCPSCGNKGVSKQWTRPQVVLIPEQESSFLAYPPKGK